MTQLILFEPLPLWTYNRGMPDLSGMSQYTVLIRSKMYGEPKETMGRGRKGRADADENGITGGRDSAHWRKTHSVETYRDLIVALMKDGECRTFNTMCVLLTGTTADVWHCKTPEQALWDLVEDETLAWTNDGDAIFFIDSAFVNWS